jgi:peptide/nickel transport system substrate-binding protein
MKQLVKLLKYLSLFFTCALLVIACNKPQVDQNPPTTQGNSQGIITLGTTLKVRTLDPADSYELAGLNVIYNVAESLYTYELGTTKLKPLLATEMPKVSDDGLSYTIPVRTGVTFHDGTPFNAEAMKFSLDRFIQNSGKPSFLLADTIESITANSETELTIKLKKPFSAFPSLLAFPGACAVSPQAYIIGQGQFKPNELIGTGPYKLSQFSSDSISLQPFEGYWGEKPVNNGINMQIYAGNSANLYNSFRTGAINVAYQSFAPEQVTSLLQEAQGGKWQNIEGSGTVVSYMVLNRNQKPLDQP